MKGLNPNIFIRKDADDIPSDECLNNDEHHINFQVDEINNFVEMTFSTRLAMYDFARKLLHESIYGDGHCELAHLSDGLTWHSSDGVRLEEASARVFIDYSGSKTGH